MNDPALVRCDACGGSVPGNLAMELGGRRVCLKCKDRVAREMAGASPVGRRRYAGFWMRFAAMIVDNFIFGIAFYAIMIPMVIVIGPGLRGAPQAGLILMFYAAFFGLLVVYQVVLVGKFGGTPGKLALGLRIVNGDGTPVSYLKALGRAFAFFLSALPMYIGFIMAAFDDEKRALHDRICDTRVIYK